MKRIIFITLLLFTLVQSIFSQPSNEQLITHYRIAESAYQSRNYSQTLSSLEEIVKLLKKSNARIEALRIKTYAEMGDISNARRSLNIFSSFKPSYSLYEEVIPYILRIEQAQFKGGGAEQQALQQEFDKEGKQQQISALVAQASAQIEAGGLDEATILLAKAKSLSLGRADAGQSIAEMTKFLNDLKESKRNRDLLAQGKKPDKYSSLGSFSEGFAVVRINEKYGFIDMQGNELVPVQYDYVEKFSNGVAAVAIQVPTTSSNEKYGITIISYGSHANSSGRRINRKYGFIDTYGKVVTPLKYDEAKSFSDDMAMVRIQDRWGFINKAGQEVIAPKYTYVESFSDGVTRVRIDSDIVYMDKSGKEVLRSKYNHSGSFHEGLAKVRFNGQVGFMDKSGEIVIPFAKYSLVGDFSEGLAYVRKGKKYGFIDKTGKLVIPMKYTNVWRSGFVNGKAEVELKGKKLFIDKNDNQIN